MSLKDLGDRISATAWVFSGFALIPPLVTTTPRKFPSSTPKQHFPGFSFMLTSCIMLRVSAMSSIMAASVRLFMTMSSTYTSRFLPLCSLNKVFINLWYVAPAFLRPKGILV
ncbi:hypothetical protein Hanom_Chr14g01333981 [Helianthus anomalus]